MDDFDLVSQVKHALSAGIPEQLLIEQMIGDGADPRVVRELIDKAKGKDKPSSPPQPPPRSQQPPPRAQPYTPVQNQPNSNKHVKSDNPDPQIKKAHKEATVQMTKIANNNHSTGQTISELQALMFLTKYLGWALMIGDGIFTYWALRVALDNRWMALYLAAGIAVSIFIIGVAINIKSVDEFFTLDVNEDGMVSASEKGWFFIKMVVIITCLSVDVLTNFMGIDTLLARTVVPGEFAPGTIVALTLAIVTMLLPQVIVSGSDINMRRLAKIKASAIREDADVAGDINYAVGYRKQVATSTAPVGEADGRKRVASWKPWERR